MFERESNFKKEVLDKDYAQHKVYLRQLKKLDLDKTDLRTPPKIKKVKRSKTTTEGGMRKTAPRAAFGVKPFNGDGEVLF